MRICISSDFSATPGARYKSESGDHSGEVFRERFLEPRFKEAKKKNEKLLIDLDGGYGYPTSFLEESFGGLARIYSPEEVSKVLEFKSEDEPSLIEEILEYIRNANDVKGK